MNFTINVSDLTAQMQSTNDPFISNVCVETIRSNEHLFILIVLIVYIWFTYFYIASIRSVELKNFDKYKNIIWRIIHHIGTASLLLSGILLYYSYFY